MKYLQPFDFIVPYLPFVAAGWIYDYFFPSVTLTETIWLIAAWVIAEKASEYLRGE